MGGMSGKGVLPTALKALKALRQETDVPLIGCGGLSSAADCRAAAHCGATIFGVGSGLTGMDTEDIGRFFADLYHDLGAGTDEAGKQVRFDIDMGFKPYRVAANDIVCEDITVVTLDGELDIRAGEYVFVWIPGVGEKPFSCLTHDPVRLAVINVGEFTAQCYDLSPGTKSICGGRMAYRSRLQRMRILSVWPVVPAWRRSIRSPRTLVTRRNRWTCLSERAQQIGSTFKEECHTVGRVTLATDDGSAGFAGRVSDALEEFLSQQPPEALAKMVFYNCGPAPMIHASRGRSTTVRNQRSHL